MATVFNGVTLSAYTLVEYAFDSDALAYIAAVEAADSEQLEPRVRVAINDFVVGCKADGIWSAIKASCIMAGARTLEGALVPLVGTAPTNVNFVSGDYNRKTGLVGDGSTKLINSNRAGNADPQNDNHASVYVTVSHSGSTGLYLGNGIPFDSGSTQIGHAVSPILEVFFRNRSASSSTLNGSLISFLGSSRINSAAFIRRASGVSTTISVSSDGNLAGNILIFARGTVASPENIANGRLSFYSIGESLDLAKLDARVSSLMSALNSAIV
jgi:hypothetical protein